MYWGRERGGFSGDWGRERVLSGILMELVSSTFDPGPPPSRSVGSATTDDDDDEGCGAGSGGGAGERCSDRAGSHTSEGDREEEGE